MERIFQRFPTMIPEMMEIIVKVLQQERDAAREIVEAIIDSEINYHFTNDQDFKDNKSNVMMGVQSDHDGPGGPGGPGGPPPQRGGNMYVIELRNKIDSYFAICLRSVKDSVPKAIGYFLVRKSQDTLQFELYN